MAKCALQQIYPKTNIKLILLIDGGKFYAISKNAKDKSFQQPSQGCLVPFPLLAGTVEIKQVKEMVTFKKALCPARRKSCQQPK